MKKIVVIIMVLTIATKILGFFRETVLAFFYGASNISDAYLISLTIPETMFAFIGIGLTTSFIPIYSNIQKCDESDISNKYMNNVINFLLLLCSLITILTWMFAPQIVKIFASGFTGETLAIGVSFTRVTVLGIYFRGILYIFKGHLRIYNNFIVSELVGLFFSLVMILSIVFSYKYSVMLLAIGFVVAKMTELIVVIPFSYKKRYRYKVFLDLKDKNLRRMIYLTLPAVMGVSVDQINTLIDRTIASKISTGGISALNYAFRLDLFIQGIFVMPVATVLYPKISKMAAENNMTGFKKVLSEAINGINLLIIPATIGAVIFAEPIVKLLFGRGAFDAQAISMTYNALIFYSVGMIGFGLREIFSRAFYSMQDTKTPMINAAIAMVMNIILNLILSKFMGIGGLAFATSISAIFCTSLLLISLRKKIGPFGIRKISITFLKILYASLIMGIIAKLSFNYLTTTMSENLSLIAAVGIGAVNYFTMIYLMKIGNLDAVVNAAKKKFVRSLSMCYSRKNKENVYLREALMNIRQIQLIELDILTEMDRVCKDNNLRYYLAYGTALGAVTRQGFIPWDTDIDIAVGIDNYKSFCEIVYRKIPAKYTLRSIYTDDNYELLKARIEPKNQCHPGIYINVFPMVGVPDNKLGRKLFSQIAYIVCRGFFIKKVNPCINYKEISLKRVIARFFKILLIPVPAKLFVWIFNKISVAFPIEKSDALYIVDGYCNDKDLVPKSYFGIPEKMMFEGHESPLPNEWEKYLMHIYID